MFDLICKIFVFQLSIVRGTPTQIDSLKVPTEQADYQTNRSGAFQVLADGSQDLAALIGLFAIRGVEKHAIDYTRGPLPPATAPLSLLGLLGYVQALLKLSLGVEFCDRSGLSIASLQSYAGTRRSEVSSHEEIVEVHYLERSIQRGTGTTDGPPGNSIELLPPALHISAGMVEWRLVKTVQHSRESMPLIMGEGTRSHQDQIPRDGALSISTCRLPKSKGSALLAIALYTTCLAFCASLSSFPIVLLTTQRTWVLLYATLGIPLSVILGGLPWCLVHITEHLPFQSCNWYGWVWQNDPSRSRNCADESGNSLRRRNSFAYFVRNDHFYVFDCRSVNLFWMICIRLASFCAAVSIAVAYVCQYIALRSASARNSGLWLAVQGILAIVRILAWVWAPNVLGFSNEVEIRSTDQRSRFFNDSLTELEITLCWASKSEGLQDRSSVSPLPSGEIKLRDPAPVIPVWLVERLEVLKLNDAFLLARKIHSETLSPVDLSLLQGSVIHWDMPDSIFARWLQLRCRSSGHEFQYVAGKRREGVAAWVCRIIMDRDKHLHMIPGISLHVHHRDQQAQRSEVIVFSRHRDAAANIFCFPKECSREHETMYHGMQEVPNDLVWLARSCLEGLNLGIIDSLWAEIRPCLETLNLVNIEAGPQ